MTKDRNNLFSLTRRETLGGVAATLASMLSGSAVWASAQPQAANQMGTQTNTPPPCAASSQTRTFLHQEVHLQATPQRIYEALLDSKQFAAFTGLPAEIDPSAGGAFWMFGKLITGRNVELIPNQRIVQAWRPASWPAGVYSIVKFEIEADGPQTKVALDHTGFPEGKFDDLNSGWPERYWRPLAKFLD
jgi:activator of HSP90 ATPase